MRQVVIPNGSHAAGTGQFNSYTPVWLTLRTWRWTLLLSRPYQLRGRGSGVYGREILRLRSEPVSKSFLPGGIYWLIPGQSLGPKLTR